MTKPGLKLETEIARLPLKTPFRISGYTFAEVTVLVATVSQGSLRGRGEASGVYYLGDEPSKMAALIEAQRPAIEAGVSRDELRKLLPPGGARNAVDCALWDLEAKRSGTPAWKLAGLEKVTPPVTTFTLGADDPETVGKAAAGLAGARALKLKLDGDLAADRARLASLRQAHPDVWLAVDANQGYSRASLVRLLPILQGAGVSLLEQPLPRGRDADLEGLNCAIPIAADESVQGLDEVAALVGRFDVVNIKLDKCGGLTEALFMAAEARRLGLKLMVGNMVGTSLAMAPAFVLAQLCDFVDLDGPTFLRADREPSVVYEDGRIWCGDAVWGGPGA